MLCRRAYRVYGGKDALPGEVGSWQRPADLPSRLNATRDALHVKSELALERQSALVLQQLLRRKEK